MLNHLGAGLLTAALSLPHALAASDLEFSMEEAIEVMRAAGTVMATESGLVHAARYCGERHPDLARPSQQAVDAWTRRNETMLQRSRQLSDMVLQAVAERSGDELANHMRHRLHEDAVLQARELAATVETGSVDDQRYLCTRMLESIEQGQWDFRMDDPAVYPVLVKDYSSE